MRLKSLWIPAAILFVLIFAMLSFAHDSGGNNQRYNERGYNGRGMTGGNQMMGGMMGGMMGKMMGSNRGGMMNGNGYQGRRGNQNQSNNYDRGNQQRAERYRDRATGPDAPQDYRNRRSLNPFTWFNNRHMW